MVSQPTFDPTSDTNTKSFLRNSGMDYPPCVLELKYGKAGIPVLFSHHASTRRTLPLMTAMPCLSVSDTVSWIFSQNFQLPVQKCRWCLPQKATWASARVLVCLLSCLVTSFIASLHCTSKWVQTVVNRAADLSMQASFEEVKALPHSSAQGEVSIHT